MAWLLNHAQKVFCRLMNDKPYKHYRERKYLLNHCHIPISLTIIVSVCVELCVCVCRVCTDEYKNQGLEYNLPQILNIIIQYFLIATIRFTDDWRTYRHTLVIYQIEQLFLNFSK